MSKIGSSKVFCVVIFGLTFLGSYFLLELNKVDNLITDEDSKKIETIRDYLNSISDNFLKDIEYLAQDENLISWGCGPSSYALALILNKKFFDNRLVVDTLYDKEPEEIIERFGFVQPKDQVEGKVIDHAWIEIFLKNKIIYIDPTVARYGRVKGIAFEVFDIGQSNIKNIYKEKYGIIDNRISLLLTKIYNNIPVDEPPYVGMIIDEESLPYYDKILKVRNTVSLGREPITWKKWVDYLVAKYP